MDGVSQMQNSRARKLCAEKRCVTDKYGLAALFCLLMILCGLPAIFETGLRGSRSEFIDLRTSVAINESWTISKSVYPMKEFFNTVSLAMSEAMSVSTNGALIHSFICNAVIGLLSLLPMIWPLVFIRYGLTALAEFHMFYSYDYTVISAGKMILTSIFLIVMYFQWTGVWPTLFRYGAYLVGSELILLCINIIGLCSSSRTEVNCDNKGLKSTLRYYIGHRNLILFQFLNYMAMSLLMAYVVLKLENFFPSTFIFVQIGVVSVIYLMHVYGQMVIILARASHKAKEAIPLKTVLYSMVTVSRYHLGTVASRLFPTIKFAAKYIITDGTFLPKTDGAVLVKNLTMFTAIYGLDNLKAMKSARYFKKKNQLVTNFQNTMLAVWANIIGASTPVIIITVQNELTGHTVEEIFAGFPILIPYVALISTYFYVIVNTMNTAENTMEFRKMIKIKDIEVMQKEFKQFDITDSCEINIVTTGADRVDEKHDTEAAGNEKKIEISRDDLIV